MAHVPNFVRLAGYKGRSDLPVEAAQNDAIWTWVTTDAELESDTNETIATLAEKFKGLESSGQSVELELMEVEGSPARKNREWTDTAERRATVEEVRIDKDRRELVVNLRVQS